MTVTWHSGDLVPFTCDLVSDTRYDMTYAEDTAVHRLDTPSRTASVVAMVERAILQGELRAGERLTERDLAERMGVSKTPVREAIKVLSRLGLVVTSEYRSTEVRSISAEEAHHIYEVRLLLEPAAVRQAIYHHNSSSLGVCEEVLQQADDADKSGDMASLTMANRRFHQALYAPCPNEFLRSTLDNVQALVSLISASAWRRRPTWREEATEHRAILAAAVKGDSKQAHDLLAAHIGRFLTGAIDDTRGDIDARSGPDA